MKNITPAQQLLNKLRKHHGQRPVKRSATDCLSAFNEHVKWLRDRHAPKSWSDEYINSLAFREPRKLKSAIEERNYCKVHLRLAADFFQKLNDQITSDTTKPAHLNLAQNSELITDFLFDLMPIAIRLEREKDPNYEFFRGGKFYGVDSWEIFSLSRHLSSHSTLNKDQLRLDHNTSQIASVFLLRQALEAKFERIIPVSLNDADGETPRLRHNFHYDFIRSNIRFYEFTNTRFTLLKTVYNWCSKIVHNPIQPLTWQISLAHDLCGPLWEGGPLDKHGGYSVHGGVRILNIEELRAEFIKHFNSSYAHDGTWCASNFEPEAVTKFYD